jgi:hypothetical protein
MPILLRIAMVISTFMGAGFALFAVVGLPAMMLGNGTYRINGAEVTKEQFLRTGGIIFYFAVPVLALYFIATSFALIKERPWSRPLLLAYLPFCGIILLTQMTLYTTTMPDPGFRAILIEFAIGSVIAWGYLYHKRAVVAYYRALRGAGSSKSF